VALEPRTPWYRCSPVNARAFLAVALALASPAFAAPVTPGGDAESRLTSTLEEILRSPDLGDADVGVHVRSIKDGRTLFARNATKLMNPASNVKLVTTAAALWHLGASYRFRTVAYRDSAIAEGRISGNLYVRGFGDPTLTDEQLFALVNDIALHGVNEVKGDLVVDDTWFDSVYEGPGWEQEHGDRSYATAIGPISTNFNTYALRVLPADEVGGPAKVMLWPPVPSIEVTSDAVTIGPSTRSRLMVGTSRENSKILVSVRGTVSADELDGVTIYKRIHNPTQFAAEHIKVMLELRGIKIKGRTKIGKVPRGATAISTVLSRPLGEVVSTLNKFSNNFIAEQILKTLGAELRGEPGTWEKGVDVVASFLAEIGVAKPAYVMGNGSGLNDINRFTPEQITEILVAMYRRFEVQPEYVASLGVAGRSGTINSRFADSPAIKRLRAKTGTLQGVSALSGYVTTRDDQLLAFSIMMNGYSGRTRSMWKVQDMIGSALADFSTGEVIAQP